MCVTYSKSRQTAYATFFCLNSLAESYTHVWASILLRGCFTASLLSTVTPLLLLDLTVLKRPKTERKRPLCCLSPSFPSHLLNELDTCTLLLHFVSFICLFVLGPHILTVQAGLPQSPTFWDSIQLASLVFISLILNPDSFYTLLLLWSNSMKTIYRFFLTAVIILIIISKYTVFKKQIQHIYKRL